ncbi:MAG TPA: polymer-forming cytoskeletal protein [Vicinamibacterales bacterium]|nr:polymer-forming cytoskeletal protein [Vicinamibacterales bacterium]
MQNAQPGSTLIIKGEITAQEPLSIAGQVHGSIDAQGQTVTIHAGAHVAADIAAAGIVVAGTVQGSLAAERRIELRAGAEVDGDLHAPAARVEDGAFLKGKVHVGGQDRVTMVA